MLDARPESWSAYMYDCQSAGRNHPFLQDVSIARTDVHLFQLYAYVSSAFISDMKNLVGQTSIQ
jgi:hypothetical protein